MMVVAGLSLESLLSLTSCPTADESIHLTHQEPFKFDSTGPRSSKPNPATNSLASNADNEITSMDCVARSLNAAASRHRARLLDRCISSVGAPVDGAGKDKYWKKPDRSKGVSHEEQLRELQEDCLAMHARMRGRMATMSASLHHNFLNQ
jgi:hypothetical protein